MSAFFRVFLISYVSAGMMFAQLVVNAVAGGKIRSGVSAQDVVVSARSLARDPAGNLVIAAPNRIGRLRADGTIETMAGNGTSGFAGDGDLAVNALLNAPTAVQYDAAGNLYIADARNYRIRRVDTSGIITTVAGTGIEGSLGSGGPATAAQLEFITAFALDQTGNLYFAETLYSPTWSRIRRMTTNGRLETIAGVPPSSSGCVPGDGGPALAACFSFPLSLAFDPTGNLYVAEFNHIRRINPDGTIVQFAGYGLGPSLGDGGPAMGALFWNVAALTADPSGTLYLADGLPTFGVPWRIRQIGTDGIINTVAGGGKSTADGPATQVVLASPDALLADGQGSVYLAEANRLRQLTAQATVQTIAGGAPKPAPDGTAASDSWLLTPYAMTVSRGGDVYIFEEATCSLRKIGADGLLSTLSGTGKCATGIPNGPVASTDLPPTAQLAVDSQNRVYGAGYASANLIYVISPAGTVTTVTLTGIPYPVIALDSKDRLYYASQYGNTISRLAPGGATETLSWPLSFVHAIAALSIDPNDNVLVLGGAVASVQSTNLLRFDQTGKVTLSVPAPGFLPLPNQFIYIRADAAGNFWCSDEIRIYKVMGTSSQVFGQYAGNSGDGGPAVAAYFSNPTSLSFAPNGDLYFLDFGNSRIRKISGAAPKNVPVINPGGILNAASFTGDGIAPGELISIFGSNFGPPGAVANTLQNNAIPATVGGTQVFFNGTPGAIVGATATQINVFVPYGITGMTAKVTVAVDGVASAAATVPLVSSAIGFVSADASGTGQGAILNQDYSVNGSSNPAARGSIISLFGTGEGAVSPGLPNGALVISTPYSAPIASPITVSIGGQPADVIYAGSAPLLPVGVFQLNVRVPANIGPGDAPIAVTVGSSTTSRQITVALQ